MSQKYKDHKRPLWTSYTNKLDNLEKADKFLDTYNLPRLNHKEKENLNRPITREEIRSVIKTLPSRRSPGPEGPTGEFYRTFTERLILILLKLCYSVNICLFQNSRWNLSLSVAVCRGGGLWEVTGDLTNGLILCHGSGTGGFIRGRETVPARSAPSPCDNLHHPGTLHGVPTSRKALTRCCPWPWTSQPP